MFKQILDRTDNSAFLNAYGSYTCFAPTNSGVKAWLAATNTASVETADINILKELVKLHLLGDTVTTAAFKDGRLPVPTMQSQFLITGVLFKDGNSSYTVNRQATVLRSNIKVGNGIIHEIDQVLTPSKVTIAQQLENNPNYSIFVEALKSTGYYTLLNTVDADTAKRWMTVLAESNQVLADSGIATYAALKTKYSNTGNPANEKDSLHIYVAYHILRDIKFLGDIINAASHQTLQPQEVISTQLINQEVVVNEDMFDNVLEKGVVLTRSTSDNAATNGVWHQTGGHYMVKFRKPAAVYWDLSSFPEIMKLPAYYKKQNYNFVRQNELDKPIKDIDWEFKSASTTLTYFYSTSSSLGIFQYNNDCIVLQLGSPSRATWVEFTTPVIIKGRYKVWICYNCRNQVVCNVRVNGDLMQRPVNLGECRPAGTDAELESIGWKRYIESTGSIRGIMPPGW
ncbi:fasciclin domain-containing protein [Paraflavitalea speifideaquila]|uniref:fasciclin domain-containing protein n=1 Tax=Paraflavitalea speifideaquila TaxID=3076558 RepID=UPI0028EAB955|nr:fasciclin domain-containing protein [Paraflavitalea speifideiaquila]